MQLILDTGTIPPDICKSMINHPLTHLSINRFIEDWEKVFSNETLLCY